MSLSAQLTNLQQLILIHPLTCEDPLRAWLRFAAWQIRSRVQDEIVFDWIEGQRLVVRRGMTGATGNIYFGLHEFFDMMLPLHLLRTGDLFLDIGANVGTFTVLAAGVRGAAAYSFEPDPENLRRLRKNIAVNHLEERVQVYDCALGATRREAGFTVGLDTQNRLATDSTTKTITVRVEKLDDVVSDAQPIMMKIDVEGAELDVLSGAERILSIPSLRVIEMETAVPEKAEILAHYGFEAASYDPFSRALSKQEIPHRHLAANCLFIRDWSFVADRLQTAAPIKIFGRKI